MAHNPFEEILAKLDLVLNQNRAMKEEIAMLKAEIKLPAERLTFTLEEAAAATGLSYSTLYNWSQIGTLETSQPGGPKGKRLVERDELLRVIRSLNSTPQIKMKVAR